MSKKTIDVTTATFDNEVLQAEVPVVMDFWAPWCGPCRRIGPALENLADSYEGKVKVIKVNVDDEPDLAMRFGVRGIPALFALKQGEVVDQMVGFGGEKPLAAMFERLST